MASRSKQSLIAYRITDGRHEPFDGTGAMLYGGRWNEPGCKVIYACLSHAGAMLERLAHLGTVKLPKSQVWIRVQAEDIEIEEITSEELPGWDAQDEIQSRLFGTEWYQFKRTPVLIVPSVVNPIERNILINQTHPDFAKFTTSSPEPIRWDERLFHPK